MYSHVSSSHKYLPRTAIILLVGICMVWAGIYGVIVTRGFNQTLLASITAYDTMSTGAGSRY